MNCRVLFLCVSFLSAFLLNAKVDTVSVHSPKMGIDVSNVVILPEDYDADKEGGYPVVYLLHGHGGTDKTWLNIKKDLPELSTDYQFILVCPDGKVSWYWDSPIDSRSQYETYVAKELTAYVDSLYNTISSLEGRAITGLSMGGHGALWLTITNPDIFGACGSMSGGVDIRPFPKNWDMYKSLGSYADNKEIWDDYTVITQIDRLKPYKTPMIIDCGQEDFFIGVNENLHKKLFDLGMQHTYTTSPGEHNSVYWNKSIDSHLRFFHEFFDKTTASN